MGVYCVFGHVFMIDSAGTHWYSHEVISDWNEPLHHYWLFNGLQGYRVSLLVNGLIEE